MCDLHVCVCVRACVVSDRILHSATCPAAPLQFLLLVILGFEAYVVVSVSEPESPMV